MSKSAILIPSDLQRLLREGSIQIVDVRTPGEFSYRRIPGSTNLPLNTLNEETIALLKEQSNGEAACVICQSGVRAEAAAKKLREAGLEKIHLLAGGLDNWMHSEMPVDEGDGVTIPLERQVRIVIGLCVLGGTLTYFLTGETWWLALPGFLGAGLVFSGISGFCGFARILARMPWNN